MIVNFPDILELFGFFQMSANLPDDFKTVRNFPFNRQFSGSCQRGGGGAPSNFVRRIRKIFGPTTLFVALFSYIFNPFGPFLTL